MTSGSGNILTTTLREGSFFSATPFALVLADVRTEQACGRSLEATVVTTCILSNLQ